MANLRTCAVPLLLLAFFWTDLAAASCISPSGGPSRDHPAVRLNIPSGIPSVVRQGILAGRDQWNASSCNIGGNDFPLFVTAGSGYPEIDIFYSAGIGTVHTSSGSTACGYFNNGAIHIFGTFRTSDGRVRNCPNTTGSVSGLTAHEIGHYLNLDNVGSSCSGFVMSPMGWHDQNGVAVWDESHPVHSMECGAADLINETRDEAVEECNDLKVDPCPMRPEGTPILLDLDRNNFHLVGLDDPSEFDLGADGFLDQIGWTSADQLDVFLCMDRNGNGIVDNGSELFGDATRLMTGFRATNGFIALAELDAGIVGGNENGFVDLDDPFFSQLLIWIDSNHNGFSEREELILLEESGVVAIDLDYRIHWRIDQHGNRFAYISNAWLVGSGPRLQRVVVTDVIFVGMD